MIVETARLNELESLINDYHLQARIEGKSAKTIAIYTTALKTLVKYLYANRMSTDVTEVGINEIKQFILHLRQVVAFSEHPFTKARQKGLAPHTINCYLRALRAFWGWLVYDEIIEVNPFDKIKIQKPPKKVIPTFSKDQIKGLLAVIDKKTLIGFRNYVIIITLLDTGMRVTELTELNLDDLSLEDRSMKVCGKGAKERIVPIGSTVQRALAKYLRKYRLGYDKRLSNRLFLAVSGDPLTADAVENFMGKYGKAAGITGVRCSPHTLRHTFALSYLRNGGDVFTLQHILGHETLDMVRNYVNVAMCDLQTVHLRCSPVDNMLIKSK